MVQISIATLSLAALAGVSIVNAQPIDLESSSDLVERGAFGRLGMIFRPLLSQSVRQAGKTTVQGHAKADKVVRRDLEDFDDLAERDFTDEEIVDLVQRGAFGRLGRIFRPLISHSVMQSGKTVVQGHAKANKVARDLEDFDDLLERDFTEDEIAELVQRGAFGRLGRIFRPLISHSVMQSGKTVVQGHAKANKVARRDLGLELDELVERLFADDDVEELLERSYGDEGLEEMD